MSHEGGGEGCARAPGDVLLAAHELWLSGADASRIEDVAASFRMSREEFERIVDVHRRIVSRGKDEPLILCRGVSCRLHGAEAFHGVLRAHLQAAGVLGTVIEVHCLSQCQHGPNVKLGDTVVCTGSGAVVVDDRPWRPVTAGPRPVEGSS